MEIFFKCCTWFVAVCLSVNHVVFKQLLKSWSHEELYKLSFSIVDFLLENIK